MRMSYNCPKWRNPVLASIMWTKKLVHAILRDSFIFNHAVEFYFAQIQQHGAPSQAHAISRQANLELFMHQPVRQVQSDGHGNGHTAAVAESFHHIARHFRIGNS